MVLDNPGETLHVAGAPSSTKQGHHLHERRPLPIHTLSKLILAIPTPVLLYPPAHICTPVVYLSKVFLILEDHSTSRKTLIITLLDPIPLLSRLRKKISVVLWPRSCLTLEIAPIRRLGMIVRPGTRCTETRPLVLSKALVPTLLSLRDPTAWFSVPHSSPQTPGILPTFGHHLCILFSWERL